MIAPRLRHLNIIVALVLVIATATMAQARRVALVIGNGTYENVAPLPNPKNDAEDIAAALTRIGFEVTLVLDLDSVQMPRTLGAFARQSEGAEVALLYFAGHGMEIDGRNYLVPTDADLRSPLDVTYQTIDLDDMLRAVSGAKALRLVMLDACRDNPFLAQMASETRSLTRGLARVEPPPGVLVSYAARGGTVAFDGEGRNSPYTRAVLEHLEEPGLEVGKLFRRVRDTVHTATDGLQEPFTYGSLPARDIFLAGALPPPDPAEDGLEVMRDFLAAERKSSLKGWREFLALHGSTGVSPSLISVARERLAALEAPRQEASITPAPGGVPQDSPLIRACDTLAADPGDFQKPADVVGVVEEELQANEARSACLVAASGHRDMGRMHYQLARAEMALTGAGKAVPHFEQAVALEYPAAMEVYGQMLATGRGLSVTNSEAGIALMERALEAGSPRAARFLGEYGTSLFSTRRKGERTPTDYYLIGAARGDAESAYQAGYRLISSSISTSEEVAEGLAYLETAADAGIARAMVRLANYYLNDSPQRDPPRAVAYLEAAAEIGDGYALNRIIGIYKSGGPVPADARKAATWILEAARRGSDSAVVQAGYLFEIGRGVSADPQQAAIYYLRSLKERNWTVYRRDGRDWDRETARWMQRLLAQSAEARYTGPIDGVIGRGSRAAMARLCRCTGAVSNIRFSDKF